MNNIVLIGFMGSGKTTFGRWVSRRHNRKFYDTDEYIEKKQNTTIAKSLQRRERKLSGIWRQRR